MKHLILIALLLFPVSASGVTVDDLRDQVQTLRGKLRVETKHRKLMQEQIADLEASIKPLTTSCYPIHDRSSNLEHLPFSTVDFWGRDSQTIYSIRCTDARELYVGEINDRCDFPVDSHNMVTVEYHTRDGHEYFFIYSDRGGIKIQLTDSVAVKTSKSDSRILRRIDYASVLTEEERKTFEGRIREITDENWKSECK